MLRPARGGVALTLAAPLLTGCVQTEVVALSTRPPFPAEVRVPEAAPVARPNGGRLLTTDLGQTSLLEGWVSRPEARLVVLVDQPSEVLSVRRFVRPASDAVAAPDDAAFRLLLRSREQPVERVCVLAETENGVVVLAGSDPAWCPAS